jgi:hypothetical protein
MAAVHQGNDLGYGKNAKDWVIRSQVLRVERLMDAVHRLNGSGCVIRMTCLRYSRSYRESGPADEGIRLLNYKVVGLELLGGHRF